MRTQYLKGLVVVATAAWLASACAPVAQSIAKNGFAKAMSSPSLTSADPAIAPGLAEADGLQVETKLFYPEGSFDEEVKNLPEHARGFSVEGEDLRDFAADGGIKFELPADLRKGTFIVLIEVDTRESARNDARMKAFSMRVKRTDLRTFRLAVAETTESGSRRFVLKNARRMVVSYFEN